MPKQHGFKGGLVLLGAVALAGANVAPANAQTRTAQSLLGVRLYDSFKTVLKKFGPPTEVRGGGDISAPNTAAKAQNSLGGAGGGMSGMPSMGGRGANSGGGMSGMPSGMGGGAPVSGMPPGMSMGGMPGMGGRGGGSPVSGMPPGMSMGGMPGMGGRGANSGGGLPGFGGAGGGMSGMPGASGGGMGGGAGATQQAQTDAGEAFWWYTITKIDPRNKERKIVTHLGFLFNKSGKVIQIQEYGYAGGQPTFKGLGLGDALGRLLNLYGWSNDGEQLAGVQTFRYDAGPKQTLAFQLVKDQVVGITLGVSSKPVVPDLLGAGDSNGENQ